MIEVQENNTTYLKRTEDSYLDLSEPVHKGIYDFVQTDYTKRNGLYFSPDGGIVYRLVSVDSMPNENDTEN